LMPYRISLHVEVPLVDFRELSGNVLTVEKSTKDSRKNKYCLLV